MSQPFDRVFVGDVVAVDTILRQGWVAARGETIAAIGQGAPPPAGEVLDFTGKLLLPGLVDGHMHTSSAIGWAGIEGTTRSAAAGGVTTCCDMPYDVPLPVTDAGKLADKIGWVKRTAHVDMALYGTITKTGGVEAIPELAAAGISAFKLSTYEYDAVRFPRIDHPTMLAAFRAIGRTGLPVAIHNEDQETVEHLTEEALAAGHTEPIWHCRTRPPVVETMADLAIFEMGREAGAHVHIAHSSLARGFEIAAEFRRMGGRDGFDATGEACIHYLCMTEADIVRLGGRGKCNPPFRADAEIPRMWNALLSDQIAYVSTDHAPWPADNKRDSNIFKCGAGLIGMQTLAPLMFTLLEERGLSPLLMARFCAERTAKLHGLFPKKGSLRVGADCDIAVLERGDFTFDEATIVDRPELRWSPYQGRKMRARVAATVLRGRLIWDGAKVLATPGTGQFVPRQTR